MITPFVKKAFGAAEAMLSPTATRFRQLVDKGAFDEAAQVYLNDQAYFDARSDVYAGYLSTLAAGLNQPFIPMFDAVAERLAAAGAQPLSEQTADAWEQAGSAVKDARSLIAEYDRVAMLADQRFRHPSIAVLHARIADLEQTWLGVAGVDECFARFDHYHGKSFFDRYPVSVPVAETLARNAGHLRERWKQADLGKLRAFASAYRPHLDHRLSSELDSAITAARKSLRGDAPIALKLIAQLRQHARADQNEEAFLQAEKLLILELTPLSRGAGGHDFRVVLSNSFHAQMRSTDLRDPPEPALHPEQSVVMLVRPRTAVAHRRVTSRSDVQSSYLAGNELLPNPEYEIARQQYLQAESDYRQQQLSNTFNRPSNAFLAVLQGVATVAQVAKRNEAFSKFQSTPPMIERPVYRNYAFPVSHVEVAKSAVVDVFVIDRAAAEYFSFSTTLNAAQRFRIASRIHPDDKTFNAGSFSRENEIDAFEAQPLGLSVEALLDAAVQARDTGQGRVADEPALLAALQAPTMTAAAGDGSASALVREFQDPRSDSVVVIQTGNSLGSGFFVAPHLVVTNHHVVAGSRTVEIKLRDGTESVGRVVKSDEGLDLALIKVPEAGKPAQLMTRGFAIGATVEAIGHPKGLAFSLTRGVVSAVRQQRSPVAGGKEILVVQTDAPISPGNSGGPLYLNDRVIGVNTSKLTAANVEGIGFALHASELQAFLESAR